MQTDLLNDSHFSTVICPLTTNVKSEMELLRIHLKKGQLDELSDILIDQMRAIDNRRLIKQIGNLNMEQKSKLKKNIQILLDL